MIVIPLAFRKSLFFSFKFTPNWLMDGRLSDVHDIVIPFVKMQRKSCSRSDSTHPHKIVWRLFSSHTFTNTMSIEDNTFIIQFDGWHPDTKVQCKCSNIHVYLLFSWHFTSIYGEVVSAVQVLHQMMCLVSGQCRYYMVTQL